MIPKAKSSVAHTADILYMSENRPIFFLSLALILTCAVGFYYNILYDFFMIFILLFSSYCIGKWIPIPEKNAINELLQTAMGLGVIGLIVYYLLLAGIGSKAAYLFVLAISIFSQARSLPQIASRCIAATKRLSPRDWLFGTVLLGLFLLFSAYAARPLEDFDSLVKHLPITVYAAENGSWYTNVVESLVYGESMVLQYTYSVVFYAFGAYKALSIFNTACLFLTFASMLMFCKSVYSKTDRTILAGIFFSVPLFFAAATRFYLDILPAFFLFTAMASYSGLKPKQSWDNLPHAAFLFGCAIFTKMTVNYCVVVVGLIVLLNCVVHRHLSKLSIKTFLIRLLQSAALLFFPFIPALLVMWYKTGSPMFPLYNGIFQSPYFPGNNFIDPFQIHPLGFNLQSLINIVFHTTLNVEMHPLGLGVFMLFCPLILVAFFIRRNTKMAVWGLVPFLAYLMATAFSYNLRYYLCVFMFFAALIAVAISVCLDKIPHRGVKQTLALLLTVGIAFPGAFYEYTYDKVQTKLIPNSDVTAALNQSVLSYVPDGKRVFVCNDDPFKGDFRGYYSAYEWHGTYWILKIINGEMPLDAYIASFDYLLYKKDFPLGGGNERVGQELQSLLDSQKLGSIGLSLISESDTHVLYQIHKFPHLETLLEARLDKPVTSSTSAPLSVLFAEKHDAYVIEQDIENPGATKASIRFQINWLDEMGQIIEPYIKLYELAPGERRVATSITIERPQGAMAGILYLNSGDDKTVNVYSYKLIGYDKIDDFVLTQAVMFEERALLQD